MASLRDLATILRLSEAASIARRPALPRPTARPTTPNDHEVLTGFCRSRRPSWPFE
jgi:hypothetical protein